MENLPGAPSGAQPQSVAVSQPGGDPLAVTMGATHKHGVGKQVALGHDPVEGLCALLMVIEGEDPWWSASTFIGHHRKSEKWLGACAAVVDVDYQDPGGQHAHPGADMTAYVDHNLATGPTPGSLVHLTPRGIRFVFVFSRMVTDRAELERALQGAGTETEAFLDAIAVSAARRAQYGDGYAVDRQALRVNANFRGPRGLPVYPTGRGLYDPAGLGQVVTHPSHVARTTTKTSSTTFAEAAAQWNADHPGDWPASSGECPICGHEGCFGRIPETDKWACFSAADDEPEYGRQGEGCWMGDALDLEAFARSCKPYEVLVQDGYLSTVSEAKVTKAGASSVVSFADIEREEVEFLMDGYLAKGRSTFWMATPGSANPSSRWTSRPGYRAVGLFREAVEPIHR